MRSRKAFWGGDFELGLKDEQELIGFIVLGAWYAELNRAQAVNSIALTLGSFPSGPGDGQTCWQ